MAKAGMEWLPATGCMTLPSIDSKTPAQFLKAPYLSAENEDDRDAQF